MDNPQIKASRSASPRRWRPRLSLRVSMVVVLMVGGTLGWQARRAAIQRRVVTQIRAIGGTIVYDYELDSTGNYRENPQPWAPSWLRQITGDELWQDVAGVTLYAPQGKTLTIDMATVEAVAALDRLALVAFSNTTLTDEQLARALDASRPKQLILMNTSVTPAALEKIAAFREVEDLSIEFARRVPGSECLPRLAKLSRLRKLGFWKVDLAGPDALADLATMTNLESLGFDRSPQDEAGLKHICKLGALKLLAMPHTRLTDDGMRRLTKLKQLETLNIDGSELTDAGMSLVANWPNLKTLHLRENDNRFIDFKRPRGRLTDAGMIALSRSTGIVDLTLAGHRITDVGLAVLGGMPGLVRLDLDGVEATRAGVQALLAARQFRFLILLGPSVADDWVPSFANQKRLTFLGLVGPQVTDAGMVAVAKLTGLRNLDISGTGITDAGLATLGRSTARWRYIFAFRTGVTKSGVDAFLTAHPGVQLIWQTPEMPD